MSLRNRKLQDGTKQEEEYLVKLITRFLLCLCIEQTSMKYERRISQKKGECNHLLKKLMTRSGINCAQLLLGACCVRSLTFG